jgi:selenoprotein W-related protein
MTSVDIEYCVPCGLLGRAQDVQEAILDEFGQQVDEVSLVTGDDGVFEVRADGDVVFDKGDDYDVDEIVDDVRSYVGASA